MKKNGLFLSLILIVVYFFISGTSAYATEDVLGGRYAEPKVVVTSYEIVEGTVANGEEFTIKIMLANMNKYAPAYNVVTAMTSSNNNIVIVDGKSNLAYFDEIAAGGVAEYTMKLKLLDLSNSGLTVLSFASTYYNSYGYEYNVESKLTLTVEERAQLEIPAITVSENAVVGANALVSVRYSNAGDSKLYNIKMKIDGNVEESQKQVALGGLEAGVQKYIDSYVTFNQDGEQKLTISFEYQDKVGNVHEIGSYEYLLNVYMQEVATETEYVVDTAKIKLGIKEVYMLTIASILLAILIVIGLLDACIKRRKKIRK